MVQVHPDPPPAQAPGAVAQLGERLPCTQEVRSSILLGSTNFQSSRRRRGPILNNSETCSRIVIQCNNNAGGRLPFGAGGMYASWCDAPLFVFLPKRRGALRRQMRYQNLTMACQPLSERCRRSALGRKSLPCRAAWPRSALDYMVKHESAFGGCLGSQRR